MLQHFGVIPYMVFDGDYLPGKAATEDGRARRREECKSAGLELLKLGKVAQAHVELQKAIDITPEMAGQLIEDLKRAGVNYLVAPYEADAQLAYLERKGVISAIISEDSDLLVFGAKCLLTKLDQYGNCVEINRADFTACRDISLMGWSDAEFRRMAILSGCDYLPGVPKMGLKTAYRLVRKYKGIDRVIRAMLLESHLVVPDGYLEAFREAELTFLHQRVFCPLSSEIVFCTEPEPGVDEDELLSIGAWVDADVAAGVARGNLHPTTKEPLEVVARAEEPMSSRSKPPRSRLSTAMSSKDEELKRGVPIDVFFKSRRTPLAELDPNSFVPSASQRRLLDQQPSTSWPARAAPARPGVEASSGAGGVRVSPSRRPLSTMQETGNRSSLGGVSAARATKRPRLCGVDDTSSHATVPAKTQEEKSRFFAVPDTLSSSTRSQARRPAKKEFSIYSETTIDEVSCVSKESRLTSRRMESTFQVFRDGEVGGAASIKNAPGDRPATRPETIGADELSKSQTGTPTSTEAEARTETHSPSVTTETKYSGDVMKRGVDGHLDEVNLKGEAVSDISIASTTTISKATQSRHTVRLSTTTTTSKATSSRPKVRPSTPLERIGVSALSRGKASHHSRGSLSEGNASTRAILGRAKTPEDCGDTKGSEDLIIPDSEDDDEE